MKDYVVYLNDGTFEQRFSANRYEVQGDFILFLNTDKGSGRWELVAAVPSRSCAIVIGSNETRPGF